MSGEQKRFGIALSFASEHRDFVEQVSDLLAEEIGRCHVLYDRYYEAELARTDLDTYLQSLLCDESELIAVFLCAKYPKKTWCGLEWRAIRDVIQQRTADVMLLRFDEAQIPGVFRSDGYVKIGTRTPREIASMILERYESGRIPKSPQSKLAMLETRLGQSADQPVSLSLRNADLVETLKAFASITGLNVDILSDVKGKVTMDLQRVPWDQVMELILRTHNLSIAVDRGIVRIAPKDQP